MGSSCCKRRKGSGEGTGKTDKTQDDGTGIVSGTQGTTEEPQPHPTSSNTRSAATQPSSLPVPINSTDAPSKPKEKDAKPVEAKKPTPLARKASEAKLARKNSGEEAGEGVWFEMGDEDVCDTQGGVSVYADPVPTPAGAGPSERTVETQSRGTPLSTELLPAFAAPKPAAFPQGPDPTKEEYFL